MQAGAAAELAGCSSYGTLQGQVFRDNPGIVYGSDVSQLSHIYELQVA